MTSVCIIQSNYVPWKGYFDLIGTCDWFVVYDEVQFTKNDWRNRNLIKTPAGLQWLSIPVGSSIRRRICDVELSDPFWRSKHWKTLQAAYGRAPFARQMLGLLEPVYLGPPHRTLSELNIDLIRMICRRLGLATRIVDSSSFAAPEGKTQRLVHICSDLGATRYVSGPAAKEYLDVAQFTERGIAVDWFDYSGYPEYPQLWGGFEHGVSILDLLFNCWEDSRRYMKFPDLRAAAERRSAA